MSEFPALTPQGEEPSPHVPANSHEGTGIEIDGPYVDRRTIPNGASRCLATSDDQVGCSRTSIDTAAVGSADADGAQPGPEAGDRPSAWRERREESESEQPADCRFSTPDSALPTGSVWLES